MRKTIFISSMAIVILQFSLSADMLSIKGTVVDNDATPLGQVVVFEKGKAL